MAEGRCDQRGVCLHTTLAGHDNMQTEIEVIYRRVDAVVSGETVYIIPIMP